MHEQQTFGPPTRRTTKSTDQVLGPFLRGGMTQKRSEAMTYKPADSDVSEGVVPELQKGGVRNNKYR